MSSIQENNLSHHIEMMRRTADKLRSGTDEWSYINGLMVDLKIELKELTLNAE